MVTDLAGYWPDSAALDELIPIGRGSIKAEDKRQCAARHPSALSATRCRRL